MICCFPVTLTAVRQASQRRIPAEILPLCGNRGEKFSTAVLDIVYIYIHTQTHTHTYLYIYIHPSIHRSIYQSIHQSIYTCVYPLLCWQYDIFPFFTWFLALSRSSGSSVRILCGGPRKGRLKKLRASGRPLAWGCHAHLSWWHTCVYIYIYVFMYVCMYVGMYIYIIYIYVYTYLCVYILHGCMGIQAISGLKKHKPQVCEKKMERWTQHKHIVLNWS